METSFTAGEDPERVSLIPIYHWCRSCLVVWKKTHGRVPAYPPLEKWKLEKYESWLKTWRESRIAKAIASADKKTKSSKTSEQTFFPPKVLAMEEFRRLYPPDKEADPSRPGSWLLPSPTPSVVGASSQ